MRTVPFLLAVACATAPPPPAVEPEPAPAVRSEAGVSAVAAEIETDVAFPLPLAPPPRPEDEDLPPPGDLMDFLYGGRLSFAEGGIPVVSIRILEGTDEVRFVPRGPIRIRTRGAGASTVSAEAGGEWRVTGAATRPAEARWWAVLEERATVDREVLGRLGDEWKQRGVATRTVAAGNLYGVAGRVLDARRTFLVADTDGSRAQADAAARDLLARFALRPVVIKELVRRPEGRLTLWAPSGAPVLESEGALEVSVEGARGIEVKQVPYGLFIGPRGVEDRAYGGRLIVAIDGEGKLAAVNAVPLEKLLRGILPAEIFARAPMEALKAQAVAARGEILAKIGTRHPGEPYLLCAEQHCQAYKGEKGEHPATDAAVAATRGEVPFAREGGPLVDAVYSAVCGGHTENNEAVWGGPPNPSLRGVPDFAAAVHAPRFVRGVLPHEVGKFVAADVPAFCKLSRFTHADRYRWERRFTAAQVDDMTSDLGVGLVNDLRVEERGVSGRAVRLVVVGEKGEAVVKGELNIRRRFGTLSSAMFELVRVPASGKPKEWIFKGGGWGHGVGMCQMGAVGRAERGQTYREILAHYYNGAEVLRIYGGGGDGGSEGAGAASRSRPK